MWVIKQLNTSKSNSDFLPEPFVFSTKTGASATDLFYIYDAIKHFHDANIKSEGKDLLKPTSAYINLQALGKAIAFTQSAELQSKEYLKTDIAKPKSSVVLIDEVDKAPRDFPNDILSEIENYRFTIKETEKTIEKSSEHKIIVILTSNSEKNLPDAFLRRCVFFHIPFPDEQLLTEIVKSHLGEQTAYSDKAFIRFFTDVRERITKKKPATAELIAWLRVLEIEQFIVKNNTPDFNNLSNRQRDILKISYSLLAKTTDDLKNMNVWKRKYP